MLNKAQLKIDIRKVLTDAENDNSGITQARENFVNGLADAFEKFVKSGTPKYTSGLTAGANAVTGVFNGSIE